ncbi:MAG: hypothetical protein PHU93_03085 [Candidatus Gracilibacteria bacterium]|nr:hypothetical protein [Candidatus Gracilibacteria bacterium]
MSNTTKKERGQIISSIGARAVLGRVVRAYDNLFGSFTPHRSMLRLEHFNTKVFSGDYKKMVRRILLEDDPQYFYKDPEQVQFVFENRQDEWNSGTLLEPWFTTTNKPSPHHIIPTSRGGNDNWKNKRFMDRIPHNHFHTVFQNLTPVEQFIVMMIIHKRILNPEFVNDMRLLHKQIGEPDCYKDGTIDKKRIK